MKFPAGTPLPPFEIPMGYALCRYSPGMETEWAAIEVSVGEFENAEESLQYFNANYLPHVDELAERMLFLISPAGEAVGTITGWWNYTGDRRDCSIHWFAVKPDCQGQGVGKALVAACMRNLLDVEGEKDIFLHTQIWSYKAIALYLKAGFVIEEKATYAEYSNDYAQAIPLLKKWIDTL